jgi:hypothetical protein
LRSGVKTTKTALAEARQLVERHLLAFRAHQIALRAVRSLSAPVVQPGVILGHAQRKRPDDWKLLRVFPGEETDTLAAAPGSSFTAK